MKAFVRMFMALLGTGLGFLLARFFHIDRLAQLKAGEFLEDSDFWNIAGAYVLLVLGGFIAGEALGRRFCRDD